jgi:uncharacterized metal-binding protein (TIGR02443 family)
MPDKSQRRRFIAGAVCPRCGLMDKIVIDLDADQRICVSCGFAEDRPGMPEAAPVPAATELPTRVSRAAARRVQTPAQPITLIDVTRGSKKPDT